VLIQESDGDDDGCQEEPPSQRIGRGAEVESLQVHVCSRVSTPTGRTCPKMAGSKFAYVRNFELPDSVLPNTFMIVRIDGKGFHKSVNLKDPFKRKILISFI